VLSNQFTQSRLQFGPTSAIRLIFDGHFQTLVIFYQSTVYSLMAVESGEFIDELIDAYGE
jgi:hypothetical protein